MFRKHAFAQLVMNKHMQTWANTQCSLSNECCNGTQKCTIETAFGRSSFPRWQPDVRMPEHHHGSRPQGCRNSSSSWHGTQQVQHSTYTVLRCL